MSQKKSIFFLPYVFVSLFCITIFAIVFYSTSKWTFLDLKKSTNNNFHQIQTTTTDIVTVTNNKQTTNAKITLSPPPMTSYVLISNNKDFSNSTVILSHTKSFIWDVCSLYQKDCPDGQYGFYLAFFTEDLKILGNVYQKNIHVSRGKSGKRIAINIPKQKNNFSNKKLDTLLLQAHDMVRLLSNTDSYSQGNNLLESIHKDTDYLIKTSSTLLNTVNLNEEMIIAINNKRFQNIQSNIERIRGLLFLENIQARNSLTFPQQIMKFLLWWMIIMFVSFITTIFVLIYREILEESKSKKKKK